MESSQNYSLIGTDSIPQRDTETDYTEWYEDAASEADWAENLCWRKDSSTVCSIEGSSHSMTVVDELFAKNKILEREWRDAETKYQNLQVDNQKLAIQLTNERHRANTYQKKLQYIQDNQDIFNRLKQAYLSMKYNETAGKPLMQVKETSSQTLECETATIKSEDIKNIGNMTIGQTITIDKNEMSKLQATVAALKTMIETREKSWSLNVEREKKYKQAISDLRQHIQMLNNRIEDNSTNNLTIGDHSESEKENALLKKIVVKLEKRHRETMRLYSPDQPSPLLNEQEKCMVHQLIRKYTSKLKDKLIKDLPIGPSTTQLISPRTHRTSRVRTATPIPTNPDTTIMGDGELICLNVPIHHRSVSKSAQNHLNVTLKADAVNKPSNSRL